MPTETVSITRGLREVRLLNDRIDKTIMSTKFVAAVMGNNFIDGKSQDAFTTEVEGYADAIETMIRRRDALKRAIVMSNARTQVTIAGDAMTVAEAIERKSSIEHEKSLLAKFVQDWSLASSTYERMAAAAAFDTSDVMNAPHIVDPLDIRERIDKLREYIENFESEVDVILSESNGHTTITVNY